MAEKLNPLRVLLNAEAERKASAQSFLIKPSGHWWSLGLLGFSMSNPEFRIEDLATFRRVVGPPGIFDLQRVLKDKSLVASIGGYSATLNFELAICPKTDNPERYSLEFAAQLVSALRIRTLSEFIVPVAAEMTWSGVVGADDDKVSAKLIEDVPNAYAYFDALKNVTDDDLKWVFDHVGTLRTLQTNIPKFRLAVEALTTHLHQASPRMTIAALWSGMEALFDVQSELRFRLSTYAASILEPRGASRYQLYRTLKAHYDFRSKAVHGSPLDDNQLSDEIRAVRTILSRLLCRFVELKHVPTLADMDAMLFE